MHHQSTLIDQTISLMSTESSWIKNAELRNGGVCLLGGIGYSYLQQHGNPHPRFSGSPYQQAKGIKDVESVVTFLARAIEVEFPKRAKLIKIVRTAHSVAHVATTILDILDGPKVRSYGWTAEFVTKFNDHPKTTYSDVMIVLERAKQMALTAESQEIADALAAKQRIEEIRNEALSATPNADSIIKALREMEVTSNGAETV